MRADPGDAQAVTALLRRFEPVIRSTKGDGFYPMDVEPYVRNCSLWVQKPGREAKRVVPDGNLSLDVLAQQPLDEAGAVHFLKLSDVEEMETVILHEQQFLKEHGEQGDAARKGT